MALGFRDVGPAPRLDLELKARLNFLTGDNGLGKTFLLDAAWWALTRTWARDLIVPHRGPETDTSIAYRYRTGTGEPFEHTSSFDRKSETWSVPQDRPPIPAMVDYAQVDGGFSVWDPARNHREHEGGRDRPAAYLFGAREVWNGLRRGDSVLSEGLIRDWASWQREGSQAFAQLTRVLRKLSPSAQEALTPGGLTRISLDDSRDHPTLRMPYGQEVALVHASAGMRRVVALAYVLVWTWQEHLRACEIQGVEPALGIVSLADEVEAHLHPEWQRRIVPALLDVMEALTGEPDVPVQVITATHSPLVLASAEPHFDPELDAVWELDLEAGAVELREFPRSRLGDANAWLTSPLFELGEPRSVEAEHALSKALELLRRTDAPTRSRGLPPHLLVCLRLHRARHGRELGG